MSEFKIQNTRYHNLTIDEAETKLRSFLDSPDKTKLFFLNLDCLRLAAQDKLYREVLNRAELVLPDGAGLKLATRILGGRLKENCNGTDFTPLILKEAARRGLPVFFLGGKEGVAERAAQELSKDIHGLRVAGYQSGYLSDNASLIAHIQNSGAQVLLVGMGVPKQEKWIDENGPLLPCKLCVGVGAFFDWASGEQKRAPLFFRRLSLEWFWRMILEPRRLGKRYLLDAYFLMGLFARSLSFKK